MFNLNLYKKRNETEGHRGNGSAQTPGRPSEVPGTGVSLCGPRFLVTRASLNQGQQVFSGWNGGEGAWTG